jgi:RNA recognition motif-containing protein
MTYSRVLVKNLPYLAKESHLVNFFSGLPVSRVSLIKLSNGEPSGSAAVYFSSNEEAVLEAVNRYNGRFCMFDGYRRLSVFAQGDFVAKIQEEEYTPIEPTRDGLKDRVHKDAVGGKWPKLKMYGMISHKNRYRRYKPPGNPKPRHG